MNMTWIVDNVVLEIVMNAPRPCWSDLFETCTNHPLDDSWQDLGF